MKYIFYSDYLKTCQIYDEKIFVSKTSKSYLIGPKINGNFDENSFYKRILSSSIYTKKEYKRCFKNKAIKLVNQYYKLLDDNEVIEVLKNDNIDRYKIIPLPRRY